MIPRTFTAYQALARQSMTIRELSAWLGWTHTQAESVIRSLTQTQQVCRTRRPGAKRFVYEVAR